MPSLAAKFRRILQKLKASLHALLKQLSQLGVLTVSSEALLKDLGPNMLLVCTQWINFKQHLTKTPEAGLAVQI